MHLPWTSMKHELYTNHQQLCFNGHFSTWAGWSLWFPSALVPKTEPLRVSGSSFLHARCRSCRLTISVKTLKESQTADINEGTSPTSGFILWWSTAGLLREAALLPVCWLFNASSQCFCWTKFDVHSVKIWRCCAIYLHIGQAVVVL